MSDVQAKREKVATRLTGISKHEPTVSQGNYREDIAVALNYYNVLMDEKQLRLYAQSFVSQYYPQHKNILNRASDLEIRPVAMLGRLIMRGQYVSPEHTLLIANRLEEISHKKPVKVSEPETSATPTSKPTIQDKIKEAVDKYAANVNEALDGFIQNKKSDFSMKQFLMTNEVSGAVAKKIADLYQPLLAEISSTDPDIQEGYSNFTKLQMKRYVAFVKGIIDDCAQHGVSAVARKPRVKKVKPASSVVSKIQYLKEFPDLNLKSIDNTKLVGAKEVWLFNTVYRKLTVLKGTDGGVLDIRGTSLYNYDLELSGTKTIRDPAKFFADTSLNKRSLTAAFKAIKTKAAVAKGRISEQVIILAAF